MTLTTATLLASFIAAGGAICAALLAIVLHRGQQQIHVLVNARLTLALTEIAELKKALAHQQRAHDKEMKR